MSTTTTILPDPRLVKVLDVPLAAYAPAEVLARITDPAFLTLCRRERTLRTAVDALRDVKDRDARTWHRLIDNHRAVKAEVDAYRIATAELLPTVTLPEVPVPVAGLRRIGEAETGSPEWLAMRQPTVGGSDVGAICKVGKWGDLNCKDVRERHLDPDPAEQVHDGLSRVGDLWEPVLLSIVAAVLDRPVLADKTTYADDRRHGNLDGWIPATDEDGMAVVEAKTGSVLADWDDNVPASYVLQTQHYTDLFGAEHGFVVANIGDERLVIYRIDPTVTVPAGEATPKMLGERFCYTDVRRYTEETVARWNGERERIVAEGGKVSKRRQFKIDAALLATMKEALDRGVVFIDLETTHFSASNGHVVELVAQDEEGGLVSRLYNVPADHLAWNGTGPVDVHRITPDMVAGEPILLEDDDAVDEIATFVGDRVVVAHNAPFEARWLTEAGLSFTYADTMRVFGALVEDEGVANNSLQALVEWAGGTYRDAHRAGPDVAMLADAYAALRPLMEAAVAAGVTDPA